RQTLPHARAGGGAWAGRSARALRQPPRQPRQRLGVARLGVAARLQHQERAERAERHALGALPDRLESTTQHVSAAVVEQQQILALAVVRSADQRQFALSGGDALERDAYRVDARRPLAA